MRLACLLILLFLQHSAYALNIGAANHSIEPTFLTEQEAFLLSFDGPKDGQLVIKWHIAEGYYLYKSRISLSGPQAEHLQLATFPAGEVKNDPYFGKVTIFKDNLALPVTYDASLPAGTKIQAVLHYQGCAEQGLCYPPQTRPLDFTIPNPRTSKTSTASPKQKADSALVKPQTSSTAQHKPTPKKPALSNKETSQKPTNSNTHSLAPSQAASINQLLASNHIWASLAALFGFGLLLAFTPCVLPMIPIVSAIVVGTRRSKMGAFYYSVIYVLAMALTYAAIGALAGLFGLQLNLQAQLQNPILLSVSALLFVILSLSMFGLFELRLPAAWQSRLQTNRDDSYSLLHSTINTALAGLFATLIVSPCVSAPVAGVLLYLSSQGDAWYGALMLFVMALGMGVPLLCVGLFGPAVLPKSGAWLNDTKVLMGFALLAVAVWLMTRWLHGVSPLFFWSMWALGIASYFFHRIYKGDSHPIRWFFALSFAMIAAVEFYGATSGARSPLRPMTLTSPHAATSKQALFSATIHGTAQLKALINNGDSRPVVLDVYADWCVSCKVMEDDIFRSPDAAPFLQKVQLVRVDLTKNTPENKAFLKRFNLFGPPALLFLDSSGHERKSLSLIGEPTKKEVLSRLNVITP